MLKLRKNKKGFTLVELIVVIAIMAVLAGTIAGVTVSQLNKQTDKTMASEAKGIADFISTWIVEYGAEFPTSGGIAAVKGTNNETLTGALAAQYDSKVDVTKPTGTKGKTFGVSLEGSVIKVHYQGKTDNGTVTYDINNEGVVKIGTAPTTTNNNTQGGGGEGNT
ncbi:MAG: type II secretion system protein [Eubacteriales bacterium]|nr:type II secretion system protein [Eubacteriales bacterium]